MDNLDPKSIAQALADLTKAKGTVQEILAITKQYNTALGLTQNQTANLEKSLENQARAAKELSLMSTDIRRSVDQRLAAERLSVNIQDNLTDIASERGQAEADLLLKQTMQKTGLTGIYAEQAKNLTLALQLGAITKVQYDREVAALQVEEKYIRHLQEEVELQEEISRSIVEIREEADQWKHSLTKAFETAKAIGRDPKVFGAFMLTQMVEKAEHVNHAMHELVDTGMQAGEAIKIMREDFSLMSAMGLSKVNDVSKTLVSQFGTANALTEEQRATIGEMAFSYGLAGDEATNLAMAISRMPGESKETATQFKTTADTVGKMKGVIPSQIMKEMAKNTGAMALYSKGGAEGFAKAAAASKQMGVELSSVLSAAEKTLDFENSINQQMEASVLIGKELNLDRLRSAALAGDANAVLEEQANIMRQVGNLDGMNTLQKKALAEAMGVTVEELTKMNEAQKFNNQYFGENSTAMDNAAGKLLKYGGAAAGFVAENGMLIASVIQAGIQLATLIAIKTTGVAADAASTASKVANTAATETNNLVKQQEVVVNQEVAVSQRSLGASAGAAAIQMLAFGAAIMMVGIGIGLAAYGLSYLVESFHGLSGPEIVGAVASIIALGGAFYFIIPALAAAGATAGITAGPLLALGGAIALMGAGIGIAAAGLSLLVTSLKDVPFENLIALPIAFMGIGAGLYMMAAAGMAALPVLGALTALAVMAPALTGLGNALGGMFGGGEGGGESDKMDTLISKIDQLIAVASQGGTVNMDGRKVGEVIRLGLNTSGIG